MVFTAVLVVVALILLTALYVAAEFATVSVRRTRVQQLAEAGNPLASWLLPILESPTTRDRYIAACQIGITVSSLVLGAYSQATIAVWIAPLFEVFAGLQPLAAQSTAAAVVLLGLTTAQVVLGELVPKSLALQYPTQTSLYTLIPMLGSRWVYRPFIAWLNGTSTALLRAMGAPTQAPRHIHSPDEIALLITESRDGGLLEPDEHRRLQRALRLNLRQARQLMVPRRRIAALEVETPLTEVVGVVAQSPYSRLPVYRGSIDNIIGMLHTKDLVRWYVSREPPPQTGEPPLETPGGPDVSLATLIRPIATAHERVTADKVLRLLRERRTHQALVVDEFGGTAGIVTLEDVLSELLGDVGDEFKAGDPVAETLADGRIRLPGRMAVDDAAVLLGAAWDTSLTTVAGLVTQGLGHLPAPGERVVVGDYELEVERVADRALESVLVRRISVEARAD